VLRFAGSPWTSWIPWTTGASVLGLLPEAGTMLVLFTGAFGNVGMARVDEALRRGHAVEVFGRHSKRMDAAVRRHKRELSAVHFGDIRLSSRERSR
jgi:hypothetical protein